MNIVEFIQRLNVHFTDEGKEACLLIIDRLVELCHVARSKGILALGDNVTNEENFFLKVAVSLIMDAENPREVQEVQESLQLLILADNYSGVELLSKLIIFKGVMSIHSGDSPRGTKTKLYMMLGEKYLSRSTEDLFWYEKAVDAEVCCDD
jgi:flagellar motor component MotA